MEVVAHVRLLVYFANRILRMEQNQLRELPTQLSIALFQIVVSPVWPLCAQAGLF